MTSGNRYDYYFLLKYAKTKHLQDGPRGWNKHPPGGVIVTMGDISVLFVTSVKADFQNCVFGKMSKQKK